LFVRNVQFDTLESDVEAMFSPFGEIKTIFDLIAKRGLVFVTYVSAF
jgi:RNA recognition motif-containing protein